MGSWESLKLFKDVLPCHTLKLIYCVWIQLEANKNEMSYAGFLKLTCFEVLYKDDEKEHVENGNNHKEIKEITEKTKAALRNAIFRLCSASFLTCTCVKRFDVLPCFTFSCSSVF